MIHIKTGSWWSPLPGDHQRIGISRGVPRGFPAGYRRYGKLNPGSWFKSCATPAEFVRRYEDEILARLDPCVVARELQTIAGGRTPVLCCWEHAGGPSWCHRSLAARFLAEAVGPVPEVGFEHLDQSQHPMLPPKA